ncbi:CoF synthetase [Neotabrizicola sp. sgz301269]|uniref:CoF synthetase n=1 Tax=Neotabrizicola sp. sgz301269 TaxID=3276282 RepID=UPI00376F8F5E
MLILTEALPSFLLVRRLSRLSRAQLLHWQVRALDRWLARDLPRAPFYQRLAGQPLSALPLTDKATLMADFSAFNTRGISAGRARAIIEAGMVQGDLIAGASTGTSGNRGLYLATRAESHRWLGAILAHALPDMIVRPQRVALILPRSAGIYGAAQGRWLQLQHFDLTEGPAAWRARLGGFAPTVLVATPKILRHLAEEGFRLSPNRVFSAAETLDPNDRAPIEARFGAPLRQIYMATEGLLAVSCAQGTLHLCEDSLHFEFEPVDDLVTPRITAFRRQTQIMARYAMNDLLRLGTCSCGLPFQAITEVAGRTDDIFQLRGQPVTPDILRNAVLTAHPGITDFRLVQSGPRKVTLTLPPNVPGAAQALAAVAALLYRFDPEVDVTLDSRPLPLDTTRKLRRVERIWKP